MPKTKIGVVDYLNARPLVSGLDRERGVKLVPAAPSALSDLLLEGRVQVALVSAIECFRHPELRILPEIGVCSEGPIKSIKLFLNKPLEAVERVALDRSSRSAATLTRLVFLEFLQKPEVDFFEVEPTTSPEEVEADAVLVIGDAALRADAGAMEPVDLGAFWTERTGLPFVYAVWMFHESTNMDAILPLLFKARDRGMPERPRIAQEAAKELGLPAAGLRQYLTRNLRYQLGEREIKGLERFRDLASEHGLCDRHDVPFLGARVQTV